MSLEQIFRSPQRVQRGKPARWSLPCARPTALLTLALTLALVALPRVGEATCTPDFDGDALCAENDNCPHAANANQADVDNDLIGGKVVLRFLPPPSTTHRNLLA